MILPAVTKLLEILKLTIKSKVVVLAIKTMFDFNITNKETHRQILLHRAVTI